MVSLNEAARRSGFLQRPLKISTLARSLGFKPELSCRKICKRPATRTYEQKGIVADDVTCTFFFGISSNGHWSFRGYLEGDMSLFGDEYLIILTVGYLDENSQTIFVKNREVLGAVVEDSPNMGFIDWGHDPFIEKNWLHLEHRNYGWMVRVRSNFLGILEDLQGQGGPVGPDGEPLPPPKFISLSLLFGNTQLRGSAAMLSPDTSDTYHGEWKFDTDRRSFIYFYEG